MEYRQALGGAVDPSSTKQCRWMLRLAAEPKRWMSVTAPTREPPLPPVRCVKEQGSARQAGTGFPACGAHGRRSTSACRLKPDATLCRYITRPAIANERLTLNRAGDVVLQLKSPYTTGPPMS